MATPTLHDRLKNYIAQHGNKVAFTDAPSVVMVGEVHAFLKGNPSSIRALASVRILRELLHSPKFRYFANESFLNAGPVRLGVRQYWREGTLPPEFNPKADVDLAGAEIAKRVLVRRFHLVLDDLRPQPRYILSIGSSVDGPGRDQRLAQHLFEEMRDRKLPHNTPGVILVGAHHAAAAPMVRARTATTRMILERHGFRCTSILLLTDFTDENDDSDDTVVPLNGSSADGVRLTSLIIKSPIAFNTTASGTQNPFKTVQLAGDDTDNSLAQQFEVIVLQKA
jgi:hypothetical protein